MLNKYRAELYAFVCVCVFIYICTILNNQHSMNVEKRERETMRLLDIRSSHDVLMNLKTEKTEANMTFFQNFDDTIHLVQHD